MFQQKHSLHFDGFLGGPGLVPLAAMLRRLAEEGLGRRYGVTAGKHRAQLDEELAMIGAYEFFTRFFTRPGGNGFSGRKGRAGLSVSTPPFVRKSFGRQGAIGLN